MSMIKRDPVVYNDGRTKQSFKDSTDINKILKKAQRTGTISHLAEYGGQYGDFSNFDFLEAQNQIAKGKQIFEALPSEVRRDFGNNPAAFFAFANDPANIGRLDKLLPEVAEPGKYFPEVQRTAPAAIQAEPEPIEAPIGSPEGDTGGAP